MDTFSHALWGKGLFGYKKYRWYAVLFGVVPDLSSFGIYFLYTLITKPELQFGKPALNEIPNWVFSLYDFSHSMVIALIFLLIAFKINREFCFVMLAWPFHIFLDFFTHSKEYFPTPILWPIFDYKFDGIPWSNPYVWFSNLFLILLLFAYRIKTNKKL